MEHLGCQNRWMWIEFDSHDHPSIQKVISTDHKCKKWLSQLDEEVINHLRMSSLPGEEAIWGSVVYQQSVEEQKENKILHYYLTKDFLLTNGIDYTEFEADEIQDLKKKIKTAENPIEGFFVILGMIVNGFLYYIDEYEERLHKLLWDIKRQNDLDTLNKISLSRHELLVWKNLLIPILEIKMAIEEAFGEEFRNGKEYIRTCRRIERGRALIKEYQGEIDSMLDLENVVSTHRGNEIMKTLTVLTTLFTPVAAWGALWGMNFEVMPELKWKLGYLVAIIIIVGNTVAVYMYLRSKGWMGDILNVRKKNSFFK
ncbi:MAG TPA: magnesium transporter CorA family protein [Chondromyces sp.]|nr:magnesium transporter CorA family protein [Chondromyces sp.]